MNGFWSGWIMFFVILNWTLVTVLCVFATRVKIPTREDGTTGHVWAHGVLREGVRKLPAWWILLSVATLAFSVYYLYQYPGFGKNSGQLAWTASKEVQQDLAANASQQRELLQRVNQLSINELAQHADVVQQGAVLFDENCAACHGRQGHGSALIGAPDLTDSIWLYGDGEAIGHSIREGRRGTMPAFGEMLDDRAIHFVAEYVFTLNGREAVHPKYLNAGKKRYASTCAACHSADGSGNPMLGAPDLTDQAWLYGGSFSDIYKSIAEGRHGVMPAWKNRLDEAQIRMLQTWIKAASSAPAAR